MEEAPFTSSMLEPPSRSPVLSPHVLGLLVLSGRLSGLRWAGSFILAGVTTRYVTKPPVPSALSVPAGDLSSWGLLLQGGSEVAQPLPLTAWSSLSWPSTV